MKINIPFKPDWDLFMIYGLKTTTARTKRYGKVGDTFEAFGHIFEIIEVKKMPLRLVAKRFYKEEGCSCPERFVKVWDSLHPRKGFQPDQEVYLHRFKKVAKLEELRKGGKNG